ncbi:MAG: hypothetical protein V1798_01195 [Pseudomonadota bacterium]
MKPNSKVQIALACFLFLVLVSPRFAFSDPKPINPDRECNTLLYLYIRATDEVQMHQDRKVRNVDRVSEIDNDADAYIDKLNGRLQSIMSTLQAKHCITLIGDSYKKLETEIAAHQMR